MTSTSTLSEEPLSQLELDTDSAGCSALVVAWSRDEPARLGEVLLIPDTPARAWTFGRGEQPGDSTGARLKLVRQRPGQIEAAGPLRCPRISRSQLLVRPAGDGGIDLENIGRCPLSVNLRPVDRCRVSPGDLIELQNELLLLCVRRSSLFPPMPEPLSFPAYPFGESDPFGLVGESAALWELRRLVALVAGQQAHVLVLGASGTGKELVARAVHAWSARRTRPMIARNAATFPEGLIDAELFGNMRNYPNPGMPERAGLVGEADGSTLFLDEFAELPIALQAHLLRVMDEGEYQRLGESSTRRSSFRLIAATNRPERYLKDDVLARLKTRLRLRGLNERRDDIPLLVRHLLRRQAMHDPSVAQRFFLGGNPRGEPRLSPSLMSALVRFEYRTHVRELESLLLRALLDSSGRYIDLTADLRAELESGVAGGPTAAAEQAHDTPSDRRPVDPKATTGAETPPAVATGGEPLRSTGTAPASKTGAALVSELEDAAERAFFAGEPLWGDEVAESAGPDDPAAEPAFEAGTGTGAGREWLEQSRVLLEQADRESPSYDRLAELCEEIKAAYVRQIYHESGERLLTAARRLQCNRDVVRRALQRGRK